MTQVSDLPEPIQAALGTRDLVVFDGDCVLCSRFLGLVLRLDRDARFSFATAQSPFGTALYAALGLDIVSYETNLVIVDGRIYQRLDAVAAVMWAVGWPWRALAMMRFIPEPLRSWLYHRVARNRFALFGRRAQCFLPSPDLRTRFIDRLSV